MSPAFSSRRTWWLCMLAAAAMLAAEQGVKWIVVSYLPLGARIPVTDWFNLVHVRNPGAAFSFLADAGGWQRHFLSLLGIGVSLALAWMLRRGVADRLEATAYVALIAGAMGNVLDRLRIGAVVDYLDLHWRDLHWPAFNLADMFIVGAASLLIWISSGLRSSNASRQPESAP